MATRPAPQISDWKTVDSAPDTTDYTESQRLSYAKPGPYVTSLQPADEQKFQSWVKQNKVPFEDDGPKTGYDLRGFWQAAQRGDPSAQTGLNPFDHRIHYSDKWKTPYSTEGFSRQSIYAQPTAPQWYGDDTVGWRLIGSNGAVYSQQGVKDEGKFKQWMQKNAPQATTVGLPAPKKTVEPDDWETVNTAPAPKSSSDYDSVLSEAGKHPIAAKLLKAIPAVTATGMGIAASESGPLAVGAAAVAGSAGKALENTLEEKFGFKPKQTSATNEAVDLGVEGAKQGGYELGGRALGALGGRALAKVRGIKPEVVGETIGGVKLPETLGQATGKPGGFSQTVEHYLSKTFMGGPLQGVKAAQQQGTREILANLSHASEAAPGALAGNWERATQETRILGDKMYGSIADTPAQAVSPVAVNILKDESLRLPTKARDALQKIAIDPETAVARKVGYKSSEEARGKLGEATWKSFVSSSEAGKTATVGDAIAARSELRDLATHSADRNLARLYKGAWEQLDGAINASLSPEQKAVKAEADRVWRRSYIQERIAKNLTRMQNVQAPSAQPIVATDSFVKMVNELAHPPLTREGGQVAPRASNLEILFDNPTDRKAMVDLASFLKTKYSTLGGQAGISESIARIGVALEALSIPGALALGHPAAAATGAAHLASMYAMAHVMANPGGAALLSAYFRSSGAAATALAGRIAGQTLDREAPPAPRQENATDAWQNNQ